MRRSTKRGGDRRLVWDRYMKNYHLHPKGRMEEKIRIRMTVRTAIGMSGWDVY